VLIGLRLVSPLLDGILKETEQRFPGVETKAIQVNVDLYGDPAIILGEGGALDFILAEFQKVDLKPNLKKFQAYTISPAEFRAALSAEQKRWLTRTFIITDSIIRSQVKHAETLASEAKAAAAVDEALREKARALGTDILNPEGDFPEQPDPTFTRDRFSLEHSQGGGGFRPTVERIPFLNSLFSALPATSGSTAQVPLWPSLAPHCRGPERLRQG